MYKRTKPGETISFRVDSDLAKALDAARETYGISRGQFARGALIQQLQRDDQISGELLELRGSVIELTDQLADVRRGLVNLSSVLLRTSGNLSADDVRRIVHRIFSDPGASSPSNEFASGGIE